MGVHRLNHAVLYVRDVARSVEFYGATLGFRPIDGMDGLTGAAFLRAPGSTNDHDLGLFQIGAAATDSAAGRSSVGLYHLAWEVDTLGELERIAGVLSSAARSSAPPTTRPRRRSMPRTPTGWSSRSAGWCRPSC